MTDSGAVELLTRRVFQGVDAVEVVLVVSLFLVPTHLCVTVIFAFVIWPQLGLSIFR